MGNVRLQRFGKVGFLLLGLFLAASFCRPVDGATNPFWQPLKIGAGGFCRGLTAAPDGSMVTRTDTYGAYRWTGTNWQQLVTSVSLPASFVNANFGSAGGVYEIQIAPSNPNIFYMQYAGYIFVSTNEGTSWTQTAFAQQTADNANDNYGQWGQKMAIDPINPNIVYAGTETAGMFVTTNGGASWQNVAAVPIGNAYGISGILFDPAGGATNGITQTIFASSGSNGVYQTTDGGASWALLSGSPSAVCNATVATNGIYYATDGTSLWSYQNATWSNLLNNGGQEMQTVAVNPYNPNEIVTINPGGSFNVSFDAGATWSGMNWASQVSSPDIPWIASGNRGSSSVYLDIGNAAFNPLVTNQLIVSAGTGVWKVNVPTTNFVWSTPVSYIDMSVGIEQLVANEIVSPPGGNPVVASWDRPFFYIGSLTNYPATYGPVCSDNIVAGWSLDYASSNPGFLVGLADWWGTEQTGYSTNGGQTWMNFPTMIPGASSNFMGGTIAASTPRNIIWAPADNQQPYYTLNGGTTWTPISLPGVSSWSDFDWAYYLKARTVTADRVLPNTFYLFFAGHGLYRTTNGGAAWTKQLSDDITPWDYYNIELKSVPGQAGHLFFTGGNQSGSTLTNPGNEAFMRSTNGGANWLAVPNVLNVSCFGFGKAAPGQNYPAIYICGWANSVYGLWQSIDNAQTWNNLATYPFNSLDTVAAISGDANIYGQVYVGFTGSGYGVLVAPDAITTVATPSISPDDGIDTNTVKVTLSCATAGATIRYTTNGSIPTSKSTAYAKTGITLTNSCTLKAIAFKTKMANSAVASVSFTIVLPPVKITTSSLPGGKLKTKYSTTLTATGGPTPYTWSWSAQSGSKLPADLTLSTTTGTITGKPTKAGTFNITVKVTDARKQTATQALSLTVTQ